MSKTPETQQDIPENTEQNAEKAEGITPQSGGIPAAVWIAIVTLFVVVIIAVVLFVPPISLAQRAMGGDSITLNADQPSYYHPDGLAVTLAEGAERARVQISTVPRQAFLDGQAGREWEQARSVLPSDVTVLSPIYTITVDEEAALAAEMAIPNGAEPLRFVDLYLWDPETGSWRFVPSTTTSTSIAFKPSGQTMHVLAAHTEPAAQTVGVVISPEGTDIGGNYGLAFVEGVRVEGGRLTGTPVQTASSTIVPLVENRNGGFAAYSDAGSRSALVGELASLAAQHEGLLLDFTPAAGYVDFVAVVADEVHQNMNRVDVVLRAGDMTQIDVAALGRVADHVFVAPGNDPTLYLPGGDAERMISTAVDNVDRRRVGLLVSALSVDVANGDAEFISFEDAAAQFGEVIATAGYLKPDAPLVEATSNVPFVLTGSVEAMGFDEALGMNYLVYGDDAETQHYVYFGSAQSLNMKLTLSRHYRLGGIAVHGLAHPDTPARTADGLTAYLVDQPIARPDDMSLVWRVESEDGATVDEASGGLSLLQYVWEAVEPGRYFVKALLSGGEETSQRGEVAVEVVGATTPTPTPTPTPQVETSENVTEPTEEPQPTSPPPSGNVAQGSFELGGQTHTLGNPGAMYEAGMTWVKFQHKWHEGDSPEAVAGRINDAHNYGFKVLLSIPGPSHPSSINYSAYVEFLRGVAGLGPDAIEVWNEMNLTREWPAGTINGATYVNNMLAPAYQAIKSVNPNVMVISGALAPTGAFGGGCGAEGCDELPYIQQMYNAGANNYADCIGVHYNEGILPPSQRSGDPRGNGEFYTRYFWGMVDTYWAVFQKQLCFTELGYLSGEGYGGLPSAFAWASETSVQEQAAWLAEAAVLASQSGKVRMMIVFNVDFTVYGEDPQAGYAMIRPGGGCPACDTLGAVMGVDD